MSEDMMQGLGKTIKASNQNDSSAEVLMSDRCRACAIIIIIIILVANKVVPSHF